MSSREKILGRLRAAQRPFEDAPPRPKPYLPVTTQDDPSPDGLLKRFSEELEKLSGQVYAVEGDAAARDCVVDLLKEAEATKILAWDFDHIPVSNLEGAIKAERIEIVYPHLHDENRAETTTMIGAAEVGLIGATAVAATTGTVIVKSGEGRSRAATALPPTLIAVVTLNQLVTRIEDWVAQERAHDLKGIVDVANVAFISGPSRTGDIEMTLVLGVHGPGEVKVVVKK